MRAAFRQDALFVESNLGEAVDGLLLVVDCEEVALLVVATLVSLTRAHTLHVGGTVNFEELADFEFVFDGLLAVGLLGFSAPEHVDFEVVGWRLRTHNFQEELRVVNVVFAVVRIHIDLTLVEALTVRLLSLPVVSAPVVVTPFVSLESTPAIRLVFLLLAFAKCPIIAVLITTPPVASLTVVVFSVSSLASAVPLLLVTTVGCVFLMVLAGALKLVILSGLFFVPLSCVAPGLLFGHLAGRGGSADFRVVLVRIVVIEVILVPFYDCT